MAVLSPYLSLVEQDVGFLLLQLTDQRAGRLIDHRVVEAEPALARIVWTVIGVNAVTDVVSYRERDCC